MRLNNSRVAWPSHGQFYLHIPISITEFFLKKLIIVVYGQKIETQRKKIAEKSFDFFPFLDFLNDVYGCRRWDQFRFASFWVWFMGAMIKDGFKIPEIWCPIFRRTCNIYWNLKKRWISISFKLKINSWDKKIERHTWWLHRFISSDWICFIFIVIFLQSTFITKLCFQI